MTHKRILRLRWVLLMIPVGLLLCLGAGAAMTPAPSTPPGIRQWMGARGKEEADAAMQALTADYRITDRSFAFREQVDFLLTPALLVQEAVSDDVVLTYPEE